MKRKYDVVIIGAGPAGIFSAIELSRLNKIKILLIDKGMDLQNRISLIKKGNKAIAISTGWGGAGAFSDGKLNLNIETGGRLNEFIEKKELNRLVKYVDEIYLKFGATEKVYEENENFIKKLNSLCSKAKLKFIPSKIRHLGTENCRKILKKMYEYLNNKIEIKFQTEVVKILTKNGEIKGVILDNGEEIETKFLIACPGRSGAEWLTNEAKRLGIETINNPVDVGVRVEVKAEILKYFTDSVYELKLIFFSKSFNDKVRTFCMCPEGYVVKEYNNDIITVNGHSYSNKKSENTNFAILVSTSFTEPFKEPITYGQYLAKLTNLLAEGIILQKLEDLKKGRRSTWERINKGNVKPTLKDVTPGDLSFALPYRYISNILEMLEAIDKIAKGVNSPDTLLYGVEVKFYSSRLKVSNFLETTIKNFFACGDGAGITRGLLQASLSGVIAAKEISKRISCGV